MKLQKLIAVDHVFLDLEARSLEEAMAAVAQRLSAEVKLDKAVVASALLERERLCSTAVGEAFAIPHCKLRGIDTITIALARFIQGLEFNAEDKQAVSFFFVVLSPPDQPAAHLQVLSQIARVLKRRELRAELLEIPDASSAVAAVQRAADLERL